MPLARGHDEFMLSGKRISHNCIVESPACHLSLQLRCQRQEAYRQTTTENSLMTVSLVSGGYHAPIGSPSLYLSCSLPLLWQSQGFLVLQSSRSTTPTSYEIRMDPPYLPSPKGYVKIRTPQNDIFLSILSADFSPAPTDSNETDCRFTTSCIGEDVLQSYGTARKNAAQRP